MSQWGSPGAAVHANEPGPRSGDAFEEACARRDFGLLQDALADMPKKQAVDHLCNLFPQRTHRWFVRNFPRLMALTPDDFGWELGYADPTGKAATDHVLAERLAS